MSLPDYRAGDQAQPGSAIAEVVDPGGLDLTTSIGERNHSNIKGGQAVDVVFDALPGKQYHGTVKSIGGVSARQFSMTTPRAHSASRFSSPTGMRVCVRE